MAQAVLNLSVGRKSVRKPQVDWNTVCDAIQDLPRSNIWLADNPVEVLNEHLYLLYRRYVPSKVIRVRNKDKPLGLMQEAHLQWTSDRSRVNLEEFVRCQVRTNETYSDAKRQSSDRNNAVLVNVQSLISGGKSTLFGTSSSLPSLVSEAGGLFVSPPPGGLTPPLFCES